MADPRVSVVMPVHGAERFVAEAVRSVLEQTWRDFELILVDDRSPDRSLEICRGFDDARLRILEHEVNRGLAATRNTGIRAARGELIALLDADDRWHPEKLERHVAHLDAAPEVGVSFSRSTFIEADGSSTPLQQMPRLTGIDTEHLLQRNPIGNGSAPVIRRQVLEEIREGAPERPCYFDESFRRSEDIECWIRIAVRTRWRIEGVPAALTFYRLNEGGLSASLFDQLAAWERVLEKTRGYAPELVARCGRAARGYQLRYLARRAVRLGDGRLALALALRALACAPVIALREPGRTGLTLAAAIVLRLAPGPYRALERRGARLLGAWQRRRIARDEAAQAVGEAVSGGCEAAR